MDEAISVGEFTISWVDQRKCFWLARDTGEGMDMGKDELERLLQEYWKENF
jgi:hypothetical protein